MAKKRWSAQQLIEILGEQDTIMPRGHSESRGTTLVSRGRAVKVGTKELEPGEQPGWMQWDCVGGNPREQLKKAYLDVASTNLLRSLNGYDVQQILANHLGCLARVKPRRPEFMGDGTGVSQALSGLG